MISNFNLLQDSTTHFFTVSLPTTHFSLDEIRAAILSMNVNASPGPDGFGPAFFKANWELFLKFDLLDLMNDFIIVADVDV